MFSELRAGTVTFFTMGYILAIWDWNVIDNDAYKSLKDLINGKGDIL